MELFLAKIFYVIITIFMLNWLRIIIKLGFKNYRYKKWLKSLSKDEIKKRFDPINF